MAKKSECNEGPLPLLAGFLMGAITGGMAAALLTRRSGEQNLQVVREHGAALRDAAQHLSAQARTTAQEVLKHNREETA